jgi:hypothetical protein
MVRIWDTERSQGNWKFSYFHSIIRDRTNTQSRSTMGTPRLDSSVANYDTNLLGNYDVICGRYKAAIDNVGNRRFRVLVALGLSKYAIALTRAHKSSVIQSIIDSVCNGGGRFLQRRRCGTWVELDHKRAYDKVGHALRDMVVAAKVKAKLSTVQNQQERSVIDLDRSRSSVSYTSVQDMPELMQFPDERYESA